MNEYIGENMASGQQVINDVKGTDASQRIRQTRRGSPLGNLVNSYSAFKGPEQMSPFSSPPVHLHPWTEFSLNCLPGVAFPDSGILLARS